MFEDRVGVVDTFMSFGRIVPAMLALGMRRGRAQWAGMSCYAWSGSAALRSVASCGRRKEGGTALGGAGRVYEGSVGVAEGAGNVLR